MQNLEISTTIPVEELKLDNSKYGKSKEFFWKYGLKNAKTVIENCVYYSTAFELITGDVFDGKLDLSEFENSESQNSFFNAPFLDFNKTQIEYFETLEILKWSYEQVINSAVYFLFLHFYDEGKSNKKFSHDLNEAIQSFCIFITPVAVSSKFGILIIDLLSDIKLFKSFPKTAANGFKMYFKVQNYQSDNIWQFLSKFSSIKNFTLLLSLFLPYIKNMTTSDFEYLCNDIWQCKDLRIVDSFFEKLIGGMSQYDR